MRAEPATLPCHPATVDGAVWPAIPAGTVADPEPGMVAALAGAVAPGGTLHLLVGPEGCADAVRAVLGCGLLRLMRTQRRAAGEVLITAVRPDPAAG